MSIPRPCAAPMCPRGAAPVRAGWSLVVLLLLVAPFAGFVIPATALADHTNIKMPFSAGATWRVLQGYNGSSHQNDSSTWQYYYSMDLVRADGNTAGQRVLSAVDGTIRWIDEETGGMSINLGDGYAFAYFHTRVDPSLAAGQTVRQGQYLGTVAPAGEANSGSTAHIHVTLWTTNDGGNWDRHATPFTGDHRLDGYNFPDKGGSNQYVNSQVVSTNTEIQGSGSGSGGVAPGLPTLSSPATGTTYRTSPTTVPLHWTAVSGATEYQVVINDGDISSPWQSGTSWTTPSVGEGQYTWQVRARNSGGTSNLTAKWVFWVEAGSSTSPTPTPTGTTALGMTLGSTSGRVGSSVQVSGTGYGANETIRFYLDSVSTAGQLAETVKANASGAWSTSVTIPDAIGGNHTVIGRGMTSDKRVSKTYKVTSYLNRNPVEGPVGTTINLTVQGFGASETVKVTFDSQTGATLASITTNAKGTGVATFKLPEASTGWHDYVGVGQTSALSAWGALNIQRSLTASPTTGAPGTSISVSAKGFPASQSMTIAWNKVSGNAGTNVCTGTTTSKGSFSCSFAIPQANAGSYPLVATSAGVTATLNIGVTGPAAVTISPASGPAGETISISAGGFTKNETVNFTWDSSSTVWQARQTDANGAVNFPALVPSLGTGTHTLRAKGVTSGKTAARTFQVTAGAPANTSQIGPGTFAVTATEEDLIGGTTSNGHVITPTDNFVALPACTQSSCPSRPVGGTQYTAACGDNCYVRVTNPLNDRCMVAPVWDVGPWFTNDNWWDPANKRNLNNLSTTKNILPQGYTGADAARDGLDVGYGTSNGIGVSNVAYQVGNRAAIDLADGTWMGIGFANGQGIGQVVVTVLWLTGEDHTAAAEACGQTGGSSEERIIAVSPETGIVGSSIEFTGTGFQPGEVVDLSMDSATNTPFLSATVSSNGRFVRSVTVQNATAGSHRIYAKGRSSGGTANTVFKVKPSVALSPGSGLPGANPVVTIRGFGAFDVVDLRWQTATGVVLLSLKTNSAGIATGKLIIPDGAVPGAYKIYGKGRTVTVTGTGTFTVESLATVALAPATGSPRSTVRANGTKFQANETVDLFWDSSTTSAGNAKSTSTGTVAVSAEVPLMPQGSHTVRLKGRTSGKSATATYTVQQMLELSPTSGSGGITVTAKGRGWMANQAVNVYWNRNATKSGIRVCAIRASATGSFTCTFTVPDSPAGTYPMQAVSGTGTANASFRITSVSAASLAADDDSGVTVIAEETPVETGTPTVTATPTATDSATPAATESAVPTETVVPTETAIPTETPVVEGTATPTETAAPTETAVPSETVVPTETPAPTATPTAELQPERRLALSPRRGPVGTEVEVSASGFEPGETANVYLTSTDSEPIASAEVDDQGRFTATIVIPDVEAGSLLIAAKGETSGTKASLSFRVTSPRANRTSDPATDEAAPTEEPTSEPVTEATPQELVFLPVADTSVSGANPDTAQSPDAVGSLAAGGDEGNVTFITFQVEGIAPGSVVSAQLVLTDIGGTGGETGRVGAIDDVWADEAGWTYGTAPVNRYPRARAADGRPSNASVAPGGETAVDVTRSVNGEGTITFVIRGTSDGTLILGSRESGAPPRLVVTVRP